MLVDTKILGNGLALINLSGDLKRASALNTLSEATTRLNQRGKRAILLNFEKIRRINMAGLAGLVEFIARHRKTDIALCALPNRQMAFLRQSGLDRGLMVFASVEAACANPSFKQHSLAGVRAVILCAGTGSRVAPLSNVTPKPMLDIAGRPALHRIMDHLSQFGLRDVLLNPGHLGYQIIEKTRDSKPCDTQVTFVNEGRWDHGQWTCQPIGSASTLLRMQNELAAFDSDFFVLCGDALIDLDLSEMMRQHRESGADATIAAQKVPEHAVQKYGIMETGPQNSVMRFFEKPNPDVTESRLANTGIYIFKPEVLPMLPPGTGSDIAGELLPKILENGGRIHAYDKAFSWIDIGCGRDYAEANTKVLRKELSFASPIGTQIREGVWAMPDARVSPDARITGPCHIGPGAVIEAGAQLEGVCSIGHNAHVASGSVLRNCIVMPQTYVAPGAWAENMILHADWAIEHTRADGTPQAKTPLENVTAKHAGAPEQHRATA